MDEEEQNMFLTQQSILENFRRVFKIHNESLALRLYNILADGIKMKRIYLPKYLATLLPLYAGSLLDKNYFAFRLLDGYNRKQLLSKDLSDILNNVLVCPR